MSVLGIPVSGKIDPTLALETRDEFGVFFGGQQINWQQVVSTSYTNSTVQWSITPASLDQVLDPKIYMLFSVQLNFTGTSSSGNL